MCGITGFISKEGNSTKDLYNLNSLIKHRGPDDEGYLIKRDNEVISLIGPDTPNNFNLPYNSISDNFNTNIYIGLAHRRLSILDLSKHGHQPMSYLENRYWIVYNGEIYNYIELREELIKVGYNFKSNTDTEVILASYHYWGNSCLSRFNGMWSFIIYDSTLSKFFIARDRFGVKPFYYWINKYGTFYFSSEIKSFTSIDTWEPFVNHQRAYDYLVWGLTDHTDETLFKNVFQLLPGHFAEFDYSHEFLYGTKIDSVKWYDLIDDNKFKNNTKSSIVDYKKLLFDSVNLRLRSDVSNGSCLSGGLDSSSIVCIVNDTLKNNNFTEKQKTFSAYSDDDSINEKYWVEQVLLNKNIEAYNVYPNCNDLLKLSKKLVWHHDEPFGSTSIFAQWKVFELASKNNVKVILDGQGADEALAGYHGYFAVLNSSYFRKFKFIKLFKSFYFLKKLHGYTYKNSAINLIKVLFSQKFKSHFRRYFNSTDSKPIWINQNVKHVNYVNPLYNKDNFINIRQMSISQLTSTNLQMLLHWEDRNSMAFSIESRVPFLDYRLVEFTIALPDEFKIKNGITKKILRDAMQDILPETIQNRIGKIGFSTPEETWIKNIAPDVFREKIENTIKKSNGFLTNDTINIFEDVLSNKKQFNFQVWRIISFGEWLDQFNVKC